MRIGEHEIAVSVRDELGKIDINRAPLDLVGSLLAQHGATESAADQAVAYIEERRKALSEPAGTGVQPFRTLEELQHVPSLTAETYERIKPAVTLYSQSASVSPALAPVEVLEALPGFDQRKIDEVLSARSPQRQASAPNVTGQTSLEGHAFTIKATARVRGNVFVRHAVVRITGSFQKPYDILRWESADSSGHVD